MGASVDAEGGLFTLNFGLDIIDRVGRLDLEGNGLAREGLDKDLHFGFGGVRVAASFGGKGVALGGAV